jgi:hypothetical protein
MSEETDLTEEHYNCLRDASDNSTAGVQWICYPLSCLARDSVRPPVTGGGGWVKPVVGWAPGILAFLFSTRQHQIDSGDQIYCEFVYHSLQFLERSQQFFGVHDETLSVAMRVHNPDHSPLRIHR